MITQKSQQAERANQAGRATGEACLPVLRQPTGTRGFTLIEIMIALFILITALLAMISTTVIIVKANSFSKTLTIATTLTKDKMEQLKNSNYDSLAGGMDYAKADGTVQTGASGAMYTRTWTVTADGTPGTGMKTVQTTVVWLWNNTSHNVTLQTIVAR